MTNHKRRNSRNMRRRRRRIDTDIPVFFITTLITTIFLALIALISLKTPSRPKAWKERVILPGDTIWTIARAEYGDEADIRYIIEDIIYENQIQPDKLCVGDVILIPVEG